MKSETVKRPVPKSILDREELREMMRLLMTAPPRTSVNDERYWRWKAEVDAFLTRVL